MRTPLLTVLLGAALVTSGCGPDGSGSGGGLSGVPAGAVRTETLAQVSHRLVLREVGQQAASREGLVGAFVADSAVELSTTGADIGVVLAVDNFDPHAPPACHPNAVIQDSACPDRSAFPYVLLDASPILEVYVDGDACPAVPGASAAELVIDDQLRLLRLRAIAPVYCGPDDLRTFEIVLTRPADAGPESQLGL